VLEVRLERVGFRYAPDQPPALDDVDLVLSGGVTALVGANGAGKSTLTRLLNGLRKPTAGRVLVDAIDTRATTVARLARRVGLVFQHPADQLFRHRLLDEVMVGPRNLGWDRELARRRALAALDRVGLAGQEDRNPYDLGFADRKLATVASVLAMDPGMLVLDEPTLAQDAAGVARLAALVGDLAAAGTAVVLVSHDMGFVADVGDRVVALEDGRIVADEQPSTFFARTDLLRRARLAPPPALAVAGALGLSDPVLCMADLVAAARRRGWDRGPG
jgi:energy-coupling factor transport system ATP-binding protein